MAVTAYASGTLSATAGGSEDFLTSPNVAGTFVLYVDTVNMIAATVIELRVYKMVLTGGTQRVLFVARYEGVQMTDDLIKASAPVSNELTDSNAVRFSLTQTKGASKNFPWVVLKHA